MKGETSQESFMRLFELYIVLESHNDFIKLSHKFDCLLSLAFHKIIFLRFSPIVLPLVVDIRSIFYSVKVFYFTYLFLFDEKLSTLNLRKTLFGKALWYYNLVQSIQFPTLVEWWTLYFAISDFLTATFNARPGGLELFHTNQYWKYSIKIISAVLCWWVNNFLINVP